MTKLFAPGDKSRAICPSCEMVVGTTFAYRDVPLDAGGGMAKGVLAAICDACGVVAAIPAQSTPAIRKTREIAEIPLEVSLPAPEVDILDAAAFKIDPQATPRFRKAIFAYYLHKFASEAGELPAIKRELEAWTAARKKLRNPVAGAKIPGRRLSFKLAARTQRRLETVLEKTGWSKTSLMRGVVMRAQKDILESGVEKTIVDLREIAEVVNA